jgi:two-component system, chemotaxis family, chemotaxis protein CheY
MILPGFQGDGSAMGLAFDKLKVLVADDNPHMRSIIAAVLKGVGIRDIREAKDGGDALLAFRDWPADLAIIDYRMTPIDGVAFTKQVRLADNSPNIYLPIIMVTGHADLSRVVGAREAGITELIVKPITAEALISRINSVIFHPRPFARTESYFGPSRRRKREGGYLGPDRRIAREG